MSGSRQETIGNTLRMYPASKRSCENTFLATNGCGCILFRQDKSDVVGSVVASRVNAIAGATVAAGAGTCLATGARVMEGTKCGVPDPRFVIGLNEFFDKEKNQDPPRKE